MAKEKSLTAAEQRELIRLRKLFKQRMAERGPRPETPPEPKPTGRQFYYQKCPHCDGSGRVPQTVGAWFIDYHYQDGHEQSNPMTKEQAVKEFLEHRDGTSIPTLIGPDGQIYTV